LHAEDNTRFCQKDDNEQTSFSDHNPRHEPKGGFRSSFRIMKGKAMVPHMPHHKHSLLRDCTLLTTKPQASPLHASK
uniref:Uncharacterized protein n=1 Tax=Nothoprocta perdicaria TaxID=30464 RepID=A0A8C6ZVK7_NOTPE